MVKSLREQMIGMTEKEQWNFLINKIDNLNWKILELEKDLNRPPESDIKKAFKKAIRKQIIVMYREVQEGETVIHTAEGILQCDRREHFIMQDIEGNLYPIKKDIFYKTYEVV